MQQCYGLLPYAYINDNEPARDYGLFTNTLGLGRIA